ncbi:hypothetical protein R5R35_010803 [Gryllus longicercus]|uniref:Uncharacterized protein n=1 Tax=Gryllus longicercus TaxID=2509291 RepID=A0AAN9VRG6_9ORTH
MSSTLFKSSQNIMFLANIQTTFLPWILELQRLEVISQTTFSCSNDSYKAKISQFVIWINRSIFAFQYHCYIELFHYQVNNLSGCCPRSDMQFKASSTCQASFISSIYLQHNVS